MFGLSNHVHARSSLNGEALLYDDNPHPLSCEDLRGNMTIRAVDRVTYNDSWDDEIRLMGW